MHTETDSTADVSQSSLRQVNFRVELSAEACFVSLSLYGGHCKGAQKNPLSLPWHRKLDKSIHFLIKIAYLAEGGINRC